MTGPFAPLGAGLRNFRLVPTQARSTIGVLLLLLTLCACSSEPAARPNIVFIFTDDQAPWALGASGYAHAQTPNIDRLFHGGAYLVNAFTTTPVCSPSRASLMASRYGTELGITEWIHPQREPDLGLDPSVVTWPEVLQQNGYRTGLVGKWHLGVPDRYHPTQTGFDYFMGFRTGGTTPSNPTLEKDGETREFEGLTPDILTDHAIEFLNSASPDEADKPFLLSLHFRAPHARWLPVADEDWAPFESLDPTLPHPDNPNLDTERVKRMTREYLASVKSVDRNVGRILSALEEVGHTEDTLIIFTSDHGYSMGHNGIWHKGNGHWVLTQPPPATENIPEGQRPNMYDHSIRVPTAVYWPGTIQAGSRVTQTVSNLDWYPTILAMAGVDLPAGELIRGRNFLPILKGESPDWDNEFYAQYSTHHQSHTHMRMYRTAEWKLIRDFLNKGRGELYNLTVDPGETTNLIASEDTTEKKVISRLDAKILEFMRETSDPVLDLAEARIRQAGAE